jgi:Putative Ig domain
MLVPNHTQGVPSLGSGRGEHAVLRVLIGDSPGGSPSAFKNGLLAAATPSPSPSTVSSDSASALPSWLLIALYGLVALIVVVMFALTAYNLTSASSTLKRIIPRGKTELPQEAWNSPLVRTLATSARVGTRTTRTTLAIAGFSLLGVAVVAVFGLSGQGVRDLRNQVIGAVTTLVAAIAGFYFGARTAESSASGAGPNDAPPGLASPDPKNPNPGFTVGQPGTFTPVVTGTPTPTVSLGASPLPSGLKLEASTGVISGTPDSGTAGQYPITLTASNGVSPDATMQITLEVSDPAPAQAGAVFPSGS